MKKITTTSKSKSVPTPLMLKASEIFKEGKHGIGWIGSDFKSTFYSQSFAPRTLGSFKKLGKYMENADVIERELNPGRCELGDVLAFLENPPEETKDGWANLFLIGDRVVSVYWDSGYGRWDVDAWGRGGGWHDDFRVFSPGLGSQSLDSDSLNSLTLEQAIEVCKKAGLTVTKTY